MLGKRALPAPACSLPAAGRLGMLWLSRHLQRHGGMLDPRPSPTAPWGLAEGFGGAKGMPGGCSHGAGRPLGWRMDEKPRGQEHPPSLLTSPVALGSIRVLHIPWGRGDGGGCHPTARVGANVLGGGGLSLGVAPSWVMCPRGPPLLPAPRAPAGLVPIPRECRDAASPQPPF